MSIQIQRNSCIGCGSCVEVCPGNLIKRDSEGKACIRHAKDCWGCTSCIKACPVNAVEFFLGADMGGRGSRLTVTETEEKNLWVIEKPNGSRQRIEINKKDANKY